jgi:hypothetical protein
MPISRTDNATNSSVKLPLFGPQTFFAEIEMIPPSDIPSRAFTHRIDDSALELTRIHRDAGSPASTEGPIGRAISHIIELALRR